MTPLPLKWGVKNREKKTHLIKDKRQKIKVKG